MTNVLLVYDVFNPSVRLCGYEQMKYLEQKGKISFIVADVKQLTAKQCGWADVVIFVRSSTWLEWKLAQRFKKAGKLVLYVLDDDVFEITPDSLSAAYLRQKSVRNRMRWFIKNSDIFVSPSRHILKKYKSIAKQTIRIEEPCLNENISNTRKQTNTKLKIGFAGSVDRAGDVQRILQEAIEEFYKRHKEEVEIEFMGAKIDLVDKLGFVHYPYEEDYEKYQKKFHERNWDIGLAPMPDTEFHRGKHYNKYIEYATIGCVGIYSNLRPYTYAIKNKENGILCGNTKKEWVAALEWCLENREQLQEIKKNIEKDIQNNFKIEKTAEQFVEQLPEIIGYKANSKGKYPLLLYRKLSWIVRGMEFVLRNRSELLKKLMEKLKHK